MPFVCVRERVTSDEDRPDAHAARGNAAGCPCRAPFAGHFQLRISGRSSPR
jgi:hypothetical protein